MNIQLSGAEEWIDQQMTSALGQVLIRYAQSTERYCGGVLAALEGGRERMLGNGAENNANIHRRCNNVLWIQAANQNNGNDTKMEG